MPFEDDDEDVVPVRPGLKISNQNSSVQSARPAQVAFDKQASEVFARSEEYKKKAHDCAQAYVSVLRDKTLPENKNSLSKDMERQVRQNLIQLGIDMNNDETQDEGAGSIGLIALLLSVIILQRDQYNTQEYRISKIEESIRDLVKSRDPKKEPTE